MLPMSCQQTRYVCKWTPLDANDNSLLKRSLNCNLQENVTPQKKHREGYPRLQYYELTLSLYIVYQTVMVEFYAHLHSGSSELTTPEGMEGVQGASLFWCTCNAEPLAVI